MTSFTSNDNEPRPRGDRALWVAIALLTGTVAGATAGWLTWLGGVAVPLAVVSGGAGFGATVSLFIALIKYVIDDGT